MRERARLLRAGRTQPLVPLHSMPADYGFDPLGLGVNPESLKYFAEAERVHARWAMLAVAGILGQELIRPDVFWYEAATKVDLPFNIQGLVAFQLITMHWVESKRGYDLRAPGSQDQDPIFSSFSLPKHEVGYPGGIFAPFVPGDLATLKVKELKNGRLAMLAFVGFVMAAQVTGKGPLGALSEHLANPIGTTIFSKAVVTPAQVIQPGEERRGRPGRAAARSPRPPPPTPPHPSSLPQSARSRRLPTSRASRSRRRACSRVCGREEGWARRARGWGAV